MSGVDSLALWSNQLICAALTAQKIIQTSDVSDVPDLHLERYMALKCHTTVT
jgi:hypothetical protein